MSNEFKYYTLSKCEEDKEFYFTHNGLFNFWNECIIFHKDDLHVIIVDNSNHKFKRKTLSEVQRQEVKEVLNIHYIIGLFKHSTITYNAAQVIAHMQLE